MTAHDPPTLDRRFITDPWDFYRDVAGNGPVQRVTLPDGTTSWLVTGHGEARELMADPRVRKDGDLARKVLPAEHSVNHTALFGRSLVNSDPPEHTRLRGLVKHAFTPRAVARLRAAAQTMADDLVLAMGDTGETDLIDAYAFPCPSG
jgi:cytochrome P450